MPFTENYQNESMLVETTACQSWRVYFETLCVFFTMKLQRHNAV